MVNTSSKSLRYEDLVRNIINCNKCPLHKFRKKPVPGEGSLDTSIMIIGEAPGRYEDETGRPFVGPAGKLLDYLLNLAELKREEVYITNVVKCRPPKNRDPRPEEIESCLPYLIEQINIIKPRLIIALGRISGKTLYELMGRKWRGMKAEHGVVVKGRLGDLDLTLIPTYHPAAALYKPDIKRILERDFSTTIKEEVERIKSDKVATKRKNLLDFINQ